MDFFTYIEMLGFACCVVVYQLMPILQLAVAAAAVFAAIRVGMIVRGALVKPERPLVEPALARIRSR